MPFISFPLLKSILGITSAFSPLALPHLSLSYDSETTEELKMYGKSVYEYDCNHYLND